MGGKSSREEDNFALPQQQVVSAGGARHGAGTTTAQQVRGASVAASQAVQCQTEQVKLALAFTKELSLERMQAGRHMWQLQVGFKADVDCELDISFHCEETSSNSHLSYAAVDDSARPAEKRSFEAGTHTVTVDIDLQRWPYDVYWSYSSKKPTIIPIALSLTAPYGAVGVQSVMHLTLARTGTDLTSKVLRQKAVVNEKEWVLQEIYGLAEMVDEDAHDENSAGQPCVICLTDPRTTAVTPCRHLCLCQDCAGAIRARNDKCPICRQQVTGIQTFHIH